MNASQGRCTEKEWISRLNRYFHSECYDFQQVHDVNGREQCERLVQEVFFARGLLTTPNAPLKKEDARGTSGLFIARHRQRPVGTLRLIHKADQLPVDRFFNFRWPSGVPREATAEFGRFVTRPAQRKLSSLVTFGLMQRALAYSREHGIRYWIGCAPALLLFGFQLYFPSLRTLPALDPSACHLAYRQDRERYFDASNNIRLFLIDLEQISIAELAEKVVDRRLLFEAA